MASLSDYHTCKDTYDGDHDVDMNQYGFEPCAFRGLCSPELMRWTDCFRDSGRE